MTSDALQLALDGRGPNVPMPALGLTLPVIVQLVVTDATGTTCWQSRFDAATRNDAATFRAATP